MRGRTANPARIPIALDDGRVIIQGGGIMGTEQCRNRLDFQDDGLVRQDIGTESERQRLTLVDRRNGSLFQFVAKGASSSQNAPVRRKGRQFVAKGATSCKRRQLVAKGGGINRFLEPRTGVPVHLDRQPNNAFR